MIKRICALLLLLIVMGIYHSSAQSIRGKIIYVHPSQVVKFKFRSAIDNYSFVNRDDASLFSVKSTGNKSLQINSLAQLRRSSNLVITEGGNTHLFILMSKDHLDAQTETFYDFSKKYNATDLVKSNNAGMQYVSKTTESQNTAREKKDATVESRPTEAANVTTDAAAPMTVTPVSQTSVTTSSTAADQKSSTVVDQKSAIIVEKKPAPIAEKKPATLVDAKSSTVVDQKSTSVQKPASTPTQNDVSTNSNAGSSLPSSQKATPSNEKFVPVVEASPSWSDSVRYDLYIQAGDSLAWVAKDYKNALKWYDSALRIRPGATLPKKQIKAVKQLQSQTDQLTVEKQRKDRFDQAMVHYKNAEAFKAERKYPEAYQEYKNCLETADTTRLSEYTSSQLYYINDAKDYVVRLQHYLPKPVVNTPPPPVAEQPKKKKKKLFR